MAQTVIHLDTSFLIRALIAGTAEANSVQQWINGGRILRISAVVWTEFVCGPLDSRDLSFAATILAEPVPFAADDGVRAGELFNQIGRRRRSLIDCMIAAALIGADASLDTSNRAEFERMRGLRLM